VQLLYAAAALELQPPSRCIDRLLVNLRPALVNLPPKALTGVIWALGTLRHRPGVDWMQVFFDQVNVLTAGGGPRALPEVSAGFGSIVLHGVTLWAAKRLGYAVADEAEELSTAAPGHAPQQQQQQFVPGRQHGQGDTPPAAAPALEVAGRVLQTAGAGGAQQAAVAAVAAAAAAAGGWGLAEGGHEPCQQLHSHQQQQQEGPERRLPQLVLCTSHGP